MKAQSVNLRERKLKEKPPTSGFLLWLQNEFTTRCRRNPNYSLRAFSLILELDASTLSQIMSGKRKTTAKTIKKICEKLDVNPKLENLFLHSENSAVTTTMGEYSQINLDTFNVIAGWYHFAILEMSEQSHFDADPLYLSQVFGISINEVKLALERLIRLGLFKQVNGQLLKSEKNFANFSFGETSRAHRELQRQIIEKAGQAISDFGQDQKDITSIFMSIDVSKLPEAKKRIQTFRRELCQFLEDGEQSRVYNLAVQLFPLEKNLKKEKK